MIQMSRRDFLKTSVVAGVTLCIATRSSLSWGALFEEKYRSPLLRHPGNGTPRYRTDALAKVTGDKIFSIDIRAQDMPGWPAKQAHAMLLRVSQANRIFEGFDLAALGEELAPDRIVTAADLQRDSLTFPPFYGEDILLPQGKTPAYLGQAVALLIWRNFEQFRKAKNRLKFRDDLIRWGTLTGPLDRPPWAAFRVVRIGGKTAADEDVYSAMKYTPLIASEFRHQAPRWASPDPHGTVDAQAMAFAQAIAKELDEPADTSLMLEREYFSQSIDTAALELDNGIGWFDNAEKTLHLVTATQSPQEVAQGTAHMLAQCRLDAQRLVLHPCSTVGYGSKDSNPFPYYAAIAALYGDGYPVRLANDRFEQFQASIKRHSFHMKYRLSVDRRTGVFQAFQAELIGDGGGRKNYSASVCTVAAVNALSIYYFPRSDITSMVLASRAPDAGSARGYGTLQSMSATEMMVDEVATALQIDPIELRLRNVLSTGRKNGQGAIPAGAQRAKEVLAHCRDHALWKHRNRRKKEFEATHPGKHYGVGFGCVQKDYGTGNEAAFAEVSISRDGEILLRHIGVEMGTGMGTSQAMLCTPWLGRPADQIRTGEVEWNELPMIETGNPWEMQQIEQDRQARKPCWTPFRASASAASNSAYFFGHATREAARLLFTQGLWPAALAIWSEGIGGGQLSPLAVRRDQARWVDGQLTAGGLEPLPFQRIVKKAFDARLATGVVVHTFNRWQWAEAEFDLDDDVRLPLDGVALRWGDGSGRGKGKGTPTTNGYRMITRLRSHYPPVQRNHAGTTYYSAIGTIAEVAVDTKSGKVELLSHHSVLECGNVMVPELVSGQLQGGLAMGIGHALHECLPLYEDGPGNGTWNFNRYRIPRARDVAVWQQTSEILPPLSDSDPPKGMAEVTMIAIVPAIVNGIAHAIGQRFRQLPVTAEQIKAALGSTRSGMSETTSDQGAGHEHVDR